MSSSWLIPFFAVIGALAFTYFVGKLGLLPVLNKFVSWWNAGRAGVVALEQRAVALEQRVKALEAKVMPSAVAPVAPVTGPTVVTGGG